MSVGIAGYRIGNGQSSGIRRLHSLPDPASAHLTSFEFQEPRSAFTSWRARKRDPKTFSLTAHDQELVLRHVTFVLQQLFQISLERDLCFNHRIEGLLHRRRQIICIDVLPLQFFPCHCLAPTWSDEKAHSIPKRTWDWLG